MVSSVSAFSPAPTVGAHQAPAQVASFDQLREAIRAGDVTAIRAFALPLPPADLKDMLALAKHADVKLSLFEKAGISDPAAMLEQAVSMNDRVLAGELMFHRGVDPVCLPTWKSHPEMEKLLNYADRRNRLYPNGVTPLPTSAQQKLLQSLPAGSASPLPMSPVHTALDHALYRGDTKTADQMLRKKLDLLGFSDLSSLQEICKAAAGAKRRDIVRAILLLGYVEEAPGFRRLPAELVEDENLSEVMKTFLYRSSKPGRDPAAQWNKTIDIEGTKNRLVCRHIVPLIFRMIAKNPDGKIDFSHFDDASDLALRAGPEIEGEYTRLMATALESHLVDDTRLGEFLAAQFADMEKNGEEMRLILAESANHVMGFKLGCKGKAGEKVYRSFFYDPNATKDPVLNKRHALQPIELSSMESYLSSDALEAYALGNHGLLTMHVVNIDAIIDNAIPAKPVRKLTSCLVKDRSDNEILWHQAAGGFTDDMKLMKARLAACSSKEERETFLATMLHDASPLHLAMGYDDGDVVDAFTELLAEVPEEERAHLAKGEDADGQSGLTLALRQGLSEPVQAYGRLLKLVPESAHDELVLARGKNNVPALAEALTGEHTLFADKAEHAKAIEAYGALFPDTLQDEHVALLCDAMPAFTAAMKSGRIAVATSYLYLLLNVAPAVPANLRARLRTSLIDSHSTTTSFYFKSTSPFYRDLQKQHPEFCQLMEKVENVLQSL
jgi:hypothetical protein